MQIWFKLTLNCTKSIILSLVGWGCRIHQLHLGKGVRSSHSISVLDIALNNLMMRLQSCSFRKVHLHCRYLSYAPPAYEYGTRPFLRWVLSQGRSPTRQAVPKMPRTPSAFPFSGRLRRRAINPTPPKRVKAWGDGPLRPEVMYPVVEHTRTNSAASNHSRSRAPHQRTQSKLRAGSSSLPITPRFTLVWYG